MIQKTPSQMSRCFVLRLCAALMALLVLCGVFCACTQPTGGEDTGDSTSSNVAVTEDTANDIYKDLPTGDFSGQEFHILNNVCSWALTTMESSEQLGDTISDAVTNRNAMLENAVGVKLVIESSTNVLSAIRKDFETQERAYDCFWDVIGSNVKLATENRLTDFNSIDGINLEKEWWYPTTSRSIAIGPAVYMLFSDIHLHFHESFYASIFNKDMLATYQGLEDPYELVKSGKWTIDKLNEMMKVVASDVDANGTKDISDSNSIYGLVAHTNSGYSMMIGFDTSLLEYDSQHIPSANFNGVNERYINAYTKVKDTIYNTVLCGSPISEGYSKLSNRQHTPFSEGRSLFMYEVTGTLKEHRDDSFSYGIITSPKYSEDQANYISPITCGASALCVPANCANPERVGIVLENMAAVSHKKVKPAYYDITLCYKYNKDPAAIEMLDTIYKNGRFELAYVYNFGSIRTTVENSFKNNVSDISGQITRINKVVRKSISDTLKALNLE